MKIIKEHGADDVAKVYIAETKSGKLIEFTQSLQTPLPIEKKWVLTISTLIGCPVGCIFCDAGPWYNGKLTADEILEQVDYLVKSRFPSMVIPVEKFKVQFARVGEPSLNDSVLEALERLQSRHDASGLIASLSTVAPYGRDSFFDNLIEIKNEYYPDGHFQLQFSIHTTDPALRDRIIPVKKWDFEAIASYGDRFIKNGDRKITLNFALESSYPFDVEILEKYFDPSIFLIKITPLNPTISVTENNLVSYLDSRPESEIAAEVSEIKRAGYDVLISVGYPQENDIGSNCGQYLQKVLAEETSAAS